MLAMLVEINGERFVLAGVEDWSILALHVNASRGRDDPNDGSQPDHLSFSVGGLTEENSDGKRYHFRWAQRDLAIGSEVRVKLVDVHSADAPIKRYRSDAEKQESPFTEAEIRELRWKDYQALKKEFEGGESPDDASNSSGDGA